MTQTTTAASNLRARVILTAFLLAFGLVAVKLVWVQVIHGPQLAEEGRLARTTITTIPAKRGSIVDANGTVLAESVETYHIAVNQQKIARAIVYERDEHDRVVPAGVGPHYVASVLAPLLEMDPAELGGKLVGDQPYVYLKKDVSPKIWREIRRLAIYGIEWESASQRVYPNGAVAASVIGNLNAEQVGVSGLEATQNQILTGEDGKETHEVEGSGVVMPGTERILAVRQDGETVHTTLRLDLQYSVEDALNAAVKRFSAEWGVAVVEEISTGNILALADSGNQPIGDQPQTSRAVQYAVEPGSVGKVLTMTSAISEGAVTPQTPITVPYEYTTADGQEFIDSHEHPTYVRTVTGVLAESSNTGTVQIGQQVDDHTRYDLMKKLGLGQLTSVAMPGESPGILVPPDQWDGRQRYTTMFGQGYAVTQLQQVAMIAAFGNGGVYQAPRLIDGWTRADGTYEPARVPEPHQAMNADVAAMVLTMLESTTADEEGTGSDFAIDGYRVAAKTGTAELFEGSTPAGTATTVAGVLPADNPTVAISVLLYRPRAGILAAQSAGPLFHDVATVTINSLGIPASATPPKLYPMQP